MTTALTPLHQECADFATSLRSASSVAMTTKGAAPPSFLRAAELFESAAAELRRLQAENERLLAQVHKLEMDALDLASENSILKRAEAEELEARKPLPVSDEQIDAIADGMPGGLGGFLKTWGWRQFARKILDLRAPPTWEPQFDFMAPGQEDLAMQFCIEIAGLRGKKGSPPDPVRLMEMCQALYKAEADARLVDKSPNLQEPPVDKTAKLQDRPLPLSDDEIIAAQEALALSRSRIGLPCTRCGTGKYRADCNAYHDFHRCDSCMHVPMWGADGNELGAAPLIASREVVADSPVRVTRLHLTDEGRAALTSKAAGPLPGITGGSS